MIITSGSPAMAKLRRAALMLIPTSVTTAFATYPSIPSSGSWTAWYDAQSTGLARQLTWPSAVPP